MNVTYFGHFFHEKEKQTNKNFDPESWRSRAVDAGDKKRIGQKIGDISQLYVCGPVDQRSYYILIWCQTG